jgi:hypothetical protein
MPDSKKSPWMKGQVHPADLPEEVYQTRLESDDAKLDRDLIAARLLDTPVPPESEWKACWACGKKVPLRFRDSVYGMPICRACHWTTTLHEFLGSIGGVVGGVADFLGGQAPDTNEDDDEEEEVPEDDEPTGEGEDAPEVAQATSPSAVEEAGGESSKAPLVTEPPAEAQPGGEESSEPDPNTKEPPSEKE